ncbi:MAG TPA: orotate phosphoribosyltransferase [Candidatus Kapabacteria bacterium]|jgi:orotate phosphoribosyltransferase|nr:orotate phosphoribosyltransferase [Candidatus Kapabacteria bacterium]
MHLYDFTDLRTEALEFFMSEGVLTFGEFTLKSGRTSPYFFNTGSLCNGRQLATLGRLYAGLLQLTPDFDEATVVFGSAYKGIPIATATAIAMQGGARENIRAVSDRKEAKSHGDKSAFLGVLNRGDKAAIVDDVITTGGTKLESIEKLRDAGCESLGFLIAFDRGEPLERGSGTAREELEKSTGLKVHPLLTVHDVIEARPEIADRLREHLGTFA